MCGENTGRGQPSCPGGDRRGQHISIVFQMEMRITADCRGARTLSKSGLDHAHVCVRR